MSLRIAIGPSSFAAEDDAPIRRLKEAGLEIVPNPFGRRLTQDEIIAHLDGVTGLIAGLEPLNATVLNSASQLSAIARVGIGMNNVDLDAAKSRGVKVSNTPDGPTEAVAEMTLAALLSLSRRLVPSNAALHAGEWKKVMGQGLSGAAVLVLGYGRIGSRVGRILHSLGAKVTVYDPHLPEDAVDPPIQRLNDLHEALAAAEIVTLHAGGDSPILGEAEFLAMQDGVLLLNSARGELVEESALIEALESDKVAGAWFDAFWEEPYKGPLTKYDQVLLTPHIGTYTRQCRLAMESAAVDNLLRDLGLS